MIDVGGLQAAASPAVFTLPLERVLEDRSFNIRIFYGDIDLLAVQLMTEGQHEPIKVRREGSQFFIVDGHRRQRAFARSRHLRIERSGAKHLVFEGDKLVLEINGGLKSGKKWYDHVETGMGGMTRPVSNGGYTPTTGTSIEVNFHKPMEALTADQVKKILLPLMDFDKHSVTKVYSETLPPATQKAIAEKRALEGMSRDEVTMAMGHPLHKYRETKDGVDLEDWIYGEPPGKVTFVTFSNSKVVKVKEQYAGLVIQVSPKQATP